VSDTPEAPWQLIVVGSGFGASFFLHEALRQLGPDARCLVLERGGTLPPDWQLANRRNSDIDASETVRIPEGNKNWQFTLAFGGGTNCWWGLAPRLHPSDFELRSRYGVGRDWPLRYDDLEPYYAAAERIMEIAGDDANAVMFPRSAPYPQPPHALGAPDRRMREAMSALHFALPSARSSVPGASRGVCCANATCNLCPTNAKFNVFNGMAGVYADPRVELRTRAEVTALETAGDRITGVRYVQDGREREARGELVVLGANAIFSAAILLRSGITGAATGRYLHEQLGALVEVLLDGLDLGDGGTATTSINYALHDGAHRRERSGVHVVFRNYFEFGLRLEPGRWRQTLPLLLLAENLPEERNSVAVQPGEARPLVSHARHSDYAIRGIEHALRQLPELLKPLPVERIEFRGYRPDEAHVQGTLRMGTDPADSVVDAGLVHHRYRNLVVVGTAVFPSCATANPSLTAAALALRAAERALS
jgi:choline dehydrogenase-like flavoprotein